MKQSEYHRLFKRPMIIGFIVLGADMLTVLAALLLNIFRSGTQTRYELSGEGVRIISASGLFGIVPAVLVILAAFAAGALIADAVVRKKSGGISYGEIAGAAGVIVLSLLAAGMSLYITKPAELPDSNSFKYNGAGGVYIVSEDKYTNRNTLSIYRAERDEDGADCTLLAAVPLNDLIDTPKARYILNVNEGTLTVNFEDGGKYRQLDIPVPDIATTEDKTQ